jgi:regulator of sigma E protease
MDILHTLFFFAIAIGLLVSFHEFGHFWVARKLGVKVLRFSVGFGKVLWAYQKSPDTPEYALSFVPLGGYVKMVDEREGEVKPEDLPYAFNRQPLWARSAIVAAGPLFNLILAVCLFWSVLIIGEEGMRPILGPVTPNTLAATAGFAEGDEILAINHHPAPTWNEAISLIVAAALESEQGVAVEVKSIDQQIHERTLNISKSAAENPEKLYQLLGLKPWQPVLKPIIGKVLPDSAASEIGLQEGDLVVTADDVDIKDWMQWVEYVQSRPGKSIKLLIERNGVQISKDIMPRSEMQADQKKVGKIGAAVKVPDELMQNMRVLYRLPVGEAFIAACERTWYYSVTTLKMMGQMVIGKASVENLSGPISIAQYAGQSAEMGLVQFFKFLGLVSVSLGVLNLLPVPVLDGGHLLFYLIEAVKGSPVPEKAQLFFQQIGITLLFSLMVLAMFLDVQRLFN